MHQTADHRFDLAEGTATFWPDTAILGQQEQSFLDGDTSQLFSDAVEQCRSTGASQILEFKLPVRNLYVQATMRADDEGVLTVITDVTESRSRDAAMNVLLREVSHRSKNLLAIVQSVAMQTAVHSDGIQDFLDKFRGRLHALSGTQDLVTESDWRGTRLHALASSQLTRTGHVSLGDVQIDGANPLLSPNASLHIGLAIHELATNAVLHGGLAEGGPGQVLIEARLASSGEGNPDLIVQWGETGIDMAAIRKAPHFGTLILEKIVPLSVGGSAEYTFSPGGVSYTLTIPADQFEL